MEILVHEPKVAEEIRKAKKQEECIERYTATRYNWVQVRCRGGFTCI
jgi:hypothetical protein